MLTYIFIYGTIFTVGNGIRHHIGGRKKMTSLLTITKNGEVVNEIEESGEKAYIRLCNLFIWKLNDKKNVKIEEVINENGDRTIQGEAREQGFLWHFTFTGAEIVTQLSFFNFKN